MVKNSFKSIQQVLSKLYDDIKMKKTILVHSENYTTIAAAVATPPPIHSMESLSFTARFSHSLAPDPKILNTYESKLQCFKKVFPL